MTEVLQEQSMRSAWNEKREQERMRAAQKSNSDQSLMRFISNILFDGRLATCGLRINEESGRGQAKSKSAVPASVGFSMSHVKDVSNVSSECSFELS
jgi:hypothetical protein